MFVEYTHQDWEETPEKDRPELIKKIIAAYTAGEDFNTAATAQRYYESDNDAIRDKYIVQSDAVKVTVEEEAPDGTKIKRERVQPREVKIEGNRIRSNFFNRLVNQEAFYLLGNGVTIGSDEAKNKLGYGFDTNMAKIGVKSIIHGVCWGFWNNGHMEPIAAYVDKYSGAVALLDEKTSVPMELIQFWRVSEKRKMHVRLFEIDGVTTFVEGKDEELVIDDKKVPYITQKVTDAAGPMIVGQTNYTMLPVFPLYANEEKRSELTLAIKTKIDLYDRIQSDFGDNLDMTNDVYWVLNNFGGNSAQALEVMKQIRELKVVLNMSDGVSAGSTAEPHSFEVPFEARQIAMDILKKAIFDDYMALDMSTLTGGYLTNIAIKAAMTGMDLKASAFEWQCFEFVQNILRLIGENTEEIRFKRSTLVNDAEIISSIYQSREDIDHRTALKLNPMINQDDIDRIMAAWARENAVMNPEEDTEDVSETETDETVSGDSEGSVTGTDADYFNEKEYRRRRGVIFR